jgi:hypothetical protein
VPKQRKHYKRTAKMKSLGAAIENKPQSKAIKVFCR